MTVFPHGRSGMIAGAMLGLGRALGETVAVLIILRSAAEAGAWSLFDGGYTFASKIASRGGGVQLSVATGAYIAAGCVLFLLTFVVNGLPAGCAWKGRRVTIHLESPVRGHFPSGQFGPQVQGPAREGVVRDVVPDRPGTSGLGAVHRGAAGFAAIVSSTWWSHSLAGVLPEQFTGGVYHALYGSLVQSLIAAVLSVPLRVMAAVYLVEYGTGGFARLTTFMVDILCRGSVNCGGAVRLHALDCDAGLPAECVGGLAGFGAVDPRSWCVTPKRC